ncbi:hypothetical protein ACJ5NV_07135 [Loktanella agnita]
MTDFWCKQEKNGEDRKNGQNDDIKKNRNGRCSGKHCRLWGIRNAV